ncbi:hypothetical protein ACFOOK_09835 [Micromonospora krabiensis]|uniref:Uncharacterized protein n=1 Tax=Micromonospora krabiensis TaxID=307121 RepID=A0A1C3NAV3_9ACTN|nr:hypothetical protein [Micromonospora krabiensis]SBV29706.1 hypothetical protein GA0070620_5286 [Micromonospora krabiensis]
MSAEAGQVLARQRYPGARHWLVSLAVAGSAAAATTTIAQGSGHFHWWAGFVLIPGALIAATGGPLLARGGGRAFAGYVVACVGALVFATGALLMVGAMSRGWPVMIILPCLAVAGTYFWRPAHPLARGLHRAVALLALSGALLGGTFQLIRAGLVDFGDTGWWGAFMMLAAVIVLGNAAELTRHRMPYRLQAITLLAGPAVVAFLLGLRFLRGW